MKCKKKFMNTPNIGISITKSKLGFSIQKLHLCIRASVVCTMQKKFMNTPNTFPDYERKHALVCSFETYKIE